MSKEVELPQLASPSNDYRPQLAQSSSSSQQRRSRSQPINSSTKRSFTPGSVATSAMQSEDLRYEFGKLAKQLGWLLECAKEFIQQLLGKTLQTLAEDDWILLVYQMRNLVSSS